MSPVFVTTCQADQAEKLTKDSKSLTQLLWPQLMCVLRKSLTRNLIRKRSTVWSKGSTTLTHQLYVSNCITVKT